MSEKVKLSSDFGIYKGERGRGFFSMSENAVFKFLRAIVS